MILGIDPGPEQSGWVILNADIVRAAGIDDNHQVLRMVSDFPARETVAIEMIASYGMAVGKDVFETVFWIGRFFEAYQGVKIHRIPRLDVKLNICHDSRAKDANIRQALIDRLGPPGTKAVPGPTYGVKSHAWAALAVAVTAQDQLEA